MLSKQRIDDDVLERYLLGTLPEDEAERLDEWSITDDEISWRVRAVENELLDTYARGRMAGETRSRFEAAWLSSPRRRRKVAFAGALASIADRPSAEAESDKASAASLLAFFSIARIATVAASLLMVAALTFIFFNRGRTTETASTRTATPSPQSRLARPAVEAEPVVQTVSFILLPPRRAASTIPSLSIPAGAQRVEFEVRLEANDYPAYRAALRDLETQAIVWQSERDNVVAPEETPAVRFAIPRSLLQSQRYSLELSGVPDDGPAEVIASYTFRARIN